MRIKLNKIPVDKGGLDELLQDIYVTAKKNREKQVQSNFTGILEVIASEPNIMDAIRRVRERRGICAVMDNVSCDAGAWEIDEHLRKSDDEVAQIVRTKLYDYHPGGMKGVWMPERGTAEIGSDAGDTVTDQIIQECVRNVLEPIAEAQFAEHSYGFRPMRSADMAVAQIRRMSISEERFLAVRGEIRNLPDQMDHNNIVSSLWGLGIRDKRVLSIIKQMLKAGILKRRMDYMPGTYQGDLTTLLANIYFTRFDDQFSGCCYVRYGNQWMVLSKRPEEAEKIRQRAEGCLRETLNLKLQDGEIQVVDIRRQALPFLALEVRAGKKNGEWVCRISPEKEEVQRRIRGLAREIFRAGKVFGDEEELIRNIAKVNFMLMDFMKDYSMCDQIGATAGKYLWQLRYTAYRTLKGHGGRWIHAGETSNLIGLHYARKAYIPAVRYKNMYIGITDISFVGRAEPQCKDQKETPYTPEGRRLYDKRMRKKGLRALTDEAGLSAYALAVGMSRNPLYNMEYFVNRSYAYKRDRGRCRICGGFVRPQEAGIRHVNRNLPEDKVNRTENLMTVHRHCRKLIYSNPEPARIME